MTEGQTTKELLQFMKQVFQREVLEEGFEEMEDKVFVWKVSLLKACNFVDGVLDIWLGVEKENLRVGIISLTI